MHATPDPSKITRENYEANSQETKQQQQQSLQNGVLSCAGGFINLCQHLPDFLQDEYIIFYLVI